MLIVTGAQGGLLKSYETTIRLTEKRCAEYGYKLDIYDLGNLGFGTPLEDSRLSSIHRVIRFGIKPDLILKSMNNTDEELVVWIDGDASLIGRIDEIEADLSFDVGVTVRPKRRKKKTSYINAGVLFFKNNDVSKKFIQDWIYKMGPIPPESSTEKETSVYEDQAALEQKILPSIFTPLWDVMGSVHEINEVRVKLFKCLQYNNFLCLGTGQYYDPSIKIIHYKGLRCIPTKPVVFEGQTMFHIEAYMKRFLNE